MRIRNARIIEKLENVANFTLISLGVQSFPIC